MKKLLASFLIIITLFTFLCPICFADDEVKLKEQVKKEKGSLFEKIVAECIAGIAETVYKITTDLKVGFDDYDTLVFNNGIYAIETAPIHQETWEITMKCYKIFALISGVLILIGVIILSYKITIAGTNVSKRNDAKESLMRLCFGGVAILLAPFFIKFLLFLNNSLVRTLGASRGSLDIYLGDSMLTSIKTGNAVTTAIIIAMFIYLFIKINIKFAIREFTIIIFTIFTPFAVGLWIINKNVTAAAIWWRSNYNEYFYAVRILLFIFSIFGNYTRRKWMGDSYYLGNDDFAISRCFNELFSKSN